LSPQTADIPAAISLRRFGPTADKGVGDFTQKDPLPARRELGILPIELPDGYRAEVPKYQRQ